MIRVRTHKLNATQTRLDATAGLLIFLAARGQCARLVWQWCR